MAFGFIVKSDVDALLLPQPNFESFESMTVRIKAYNYLTMTLLYRPPPSSKNGLAPGVFITEVGKKLTHLCTTCPGNICVLGDFNLHCDVKEAHLANTFKDILAPLYLEQHIKQQHTEVGIHWISLLHGRIPHLPW